jgi:hypothetical protein
MTPEEKKVYNREYAQRKAAERKAHKAAVLVKKQAAAAKARAAKMAKRNGKPVLTEREDEGCLHNRWGVGIQGNTIAFFIDGGVVFEHTFIQQEE